MDAAIATAITLTVVGLRETVLFRRFCNCVDGKQLHGVVLKSPKGWRKIFRKI